MTPSRGRGPLDAKIMVVGEAYGKHEELANKPFVGPAGKLLDELLLKAGINPAKVYFTNIVNQRPPDNDLAAWLRHGIPNEIAQEGISSLAEEVATIQPNVIIPLGNWPLWAFYGQKLNKEGVPTGILDYRGYVLEARRLGRGKKIIPTVHPSYLLQGGYADSPLAIFDLQRAHTQAAFPEIRRKPRRCYIDPQGEEREALRHRLLSEGRYLGTDIEYFGSSLYCVGFAVSSDWAVTIRIRTPQDLDWCRELIESGKPLLAQNAIFDLGILEWHYQIDGLKNLAFDTMVAAYNLNIEYPKDLGFLGGMYTDLPAWWDVIDWTKINAGRQDKDLVLPYNCYDCMATVEIAEQQDVELDEDPKVREAFKFDMAKLLPLWQVSKLGVPIDVEKIRELKIKCQHDAQEGQAALNLIAEGVGMNLRGVDLNVKSGPQMIEFLFGFLEIPPGGRTPPSSRFPKGQLKTDNITLMECMRKEPSATKRKAMELVIRTREARDIQSKFVEIEWDRDGRARCIYDPTKTTTRRLSSKKFFPTGLGSNLQNIPAPGSSRYGTAVRSGFRADPGRRFGYADLKGAEFLVVAQETQDPLMLKYAQMSIDGSGDVHCETAAFIFSRLRGQTIHPEDIGKKSSERYLGKKTRHSGNYMIGWKKFMGNINAEALETGVYITAAESKGIINAYTELHPGLPRWWDWVEMELRSKGYLRNLFGFKRHFHGRWSEILPEAVAFRPQSTIGDALNFGLVAIMNDYELKQADVEVLLQVHDAIGFQYPPENEDFVLPRIEKLMDIPIPIQSTGLDLHIPVEIAIGPNWGELEEWKR